ncbi:MAG: 30S ribosomal protein S13 [archaeon]|nr:MAG: 30S ribosomal protein S13 [archaeon]
MAKKEEEPKENKTEEDVKVNAGPEKTENKEKIAEEKEIKTEPKRGAKKEAEENVVEIVRFLSTDLNGKLKIKNSLRKIGGISFTTSKVFCEKAGVDPNKVTGTLDEKEIKKLEDVIKNPGKYDVPDYILNLRKNPYTGKDEHFTGAELHIQTRKIIGDMKKLGSYVGIRHRRGLPVRGQRTRSSFRKSKSVGVSKKRQQPGKK